MTRNPFVAMFGFVPQNFIATIPEGDDRERLVCQDCGFINYVNPKVVVGAVVLWGSEILLCKRNIEPRKGYWTVPAGFMEVNETAQEGAIRETWEEALARIEIDGLLAAYTFPHISQVHLMFTSRLLEKRFGPGPESMEVRLFTYENIPWDDLAFPSNHWTLHHHKESLTKGPGPAFIEAPKGLKLPPPML